MTLTKWSSVGYDADDGVIQLVGCNVTAIVKSDLSRGRHEQTTDPSCYKER